MESSDSTMAVLTVGRVATITVEKFSDANGTDGLRFSYAPVEAEQDPILLDRFSPLELTLNFTGLGVQFPPPEELVILSALMTSTPTGDGGADSAIVVSGITAM